jgi:beta-lactamase regulating signal transducer with metallopeptidase domain/archaellum component FlaC
MPAEILRASSSLLAHVAEPAARSIVLGCCAAVALGALRLRNVAARMLVWRGVLAAALAMPLLGLLVLPVRVSVPAPLTNMTKLAKYVPSVEPSREPSTEPSGKTDPRFGAADRLTAVIKVPVAHAMGERAKSKRARIESLNPPQSAELMPTESPSSLVLGPTAPSQTRSQIPWVLLLAAIYVAITIVFFVRMLVGMRFAAKLEGATVCIKDKRAQAILAGVSRTAGLRAIPRLAESEMLSVPVTLGVRNPVILFPVEWRGWESGELEAVLAHEISHVARRDALVQRFALIHRAIFWFSPFAWWLEKHLVDLSEQASDEAALASGADRTRYAETLLGFFATLEGAPQRVWWQGVSMAKAGQAEKRVDRILAWRGAMSNKLTRSLVVALVAVAAPVVLLTASVHPTVNNFQEPIVDPEPQSAVLPQTPVRPQAAPAPVAPQLPTNPTVNMAAPPADPDASDVPPLAPTSPEAPVAALAPVAAVAPLTPMEFDGQVPMPPPTASNSGELQQAYDALRRAEEAVAKANQKIAAANAAIASANTARHLEAVKTAKAAYKAAFADYKTNLKHYYALAAEAREIAEEAQSIGGVNGGVYGGVSGGVGGQRIYRQPIGNGDEQYRIVGSYSGDWGPRYVIVTKGSGEVMMSGTEEDAEHARSLRNKISGDFIWFERDEKSYIITDADFISKAKALFAPQAELERKQDELGRQQDELGRQQDALGKQMDDIKVKIPDITPDLERVRAELDELRRQNGGTQRDLGRLQSELGRLQSEVGHYQSDAGRQQSEIGHQQGELGRKQGELGRQQGELGREQGELARKASRELRDMFSEAIDKGIAKPE